MVRSPQAFLMDEPLSNLDAKLRLHTRGELKRLHYELGITTIYVTHDQAEALTLATRVAVMDSGRLQQFDTPLNIYRFPANRFVASFIGNPGMNLLDGILDVSQRRFVSDGFQLELDERTLTRVENLGPSVTLGFRPEDVRLSLEGRGGAFPAKVYVTEDLGNETQISLRVGPHSVMARGGPRLSLNIEDQVWVVLNEQDLHFFDTESGCRLSQS